jgi:exodeoxyribonuclease V gamma subunit
VGREPASAGGGVYSAFNPTGPASLLQVFLAPALLPLLEALAERLAQPLPSVFATEHVVVPARATGDWLAAELSDRLGIWSGHAVYTPARMLAMLGRSEAEGPDAWSLLNALTALQDRPGFEAPRRYLAGDDIGLRALQLAMRISGLFRRYARYRPDMIRSWASGGGEGWQPELWRAAVANGSDPVSAVDALLAGLDCHSLPSRLSVFGVPHLAPLELELLHGVALHTDVVVYTLADTPLHRALDDAPATELGAPWPATTLGTVQAGGSPTTLDGTLRIHACHGRQREVEVLRDALLARFSADPTLQPEDVLVLAPDVNDYAPLVEGVFGTEADVHKAPGSRARIPACFADRAPLAEAPALAAFRRVLSLVGSRRPQSLVAELLDAEPVQARFGFSEAQGAQMRAWLEAAAVRWGEDADFRLRFDNPALPEHSWRWGLDRLLLGYAIEGNGQRVYAGLLPVDGIEGPEAQPLGALCGFCETLFDQLRLLEQSRAVAAWPEVLLGAYDALISSWGEWARSRDRLESLLGELHGDQVLAMPALLPWLDGGLELQQRHERFFGGGVTFASLRVGRAIPARVVCLLGLDHDRFPHDPAALAFDLIEQDPRPGDLPPRDEDRLAFSTALRSAGEHLHLSYVGQGSRDNKERPPSVLVAELMDLLGPNLAAQATVEHPMQPFSPRAFGDPVPPSFATPWHAGAQALLGGAQEPPPFFAGPLPPDKEAGIVSLAQLVRFFRNPVAQLLKVRLELRFEEEEEAVPDREPFALNALEKWQVGERIVQALVAGQDAGSLWPVLRGSGLLPMGTPGRMLFDELAAVAGGIASEALACGAGEALDDIDVDLAVGEHRVLGFLDGRRTRGALYVSYAKLGPKRLLPAWIKHLVATVAGLQPQRAWVVGRGPASSTARQDFAAVVEPERSLRALLDLYARGMCEPLPFMPDSSFAYAGGYLQGLEQSGGDEDEARRMGQAAAARSWHGKTLWGHGYVPGDGEDPAVARVFDATALASETFHRAALIVCLPAMGQRIPDEVAP